MFNIGSKNEKRLDKLKVEISSYSPYTRKKYAIRAFQRTKGKRKVTADLLGRLGYSENEIKHARKHANRFDRLGFNL